MFVAKIILSFILAWYCSLLTCTVIAVIGKSFSKKKNDEKSIKVVDRQRFDEMTLACYLEGILFAIVFITLMVERGVLR